jgi:hypothetical protein
LAWQSFEPILILNTYILLSPDGTGAGAQGDGPKTRALLCGVAVPNAVAIVAEDKYTVGFAKRAKKWATLHHF